MTPLPFRREDLAVRPVGRSETIPSSWYLSPEVFAFERDAVFADSWQYAGPSAGLEDAGSYRAAEAAGDPAFVVRGNDGALRAFYNVCRHRGGPLVTDAEGRKAMLQCGYHGWTYTCEGTLRGVPRFDRVELFDRRDYGLVPLGLAAWENLLFVRASGKQSRARRAGGGPGDPPPEAWNPPGRLPRDGALEAILDAVRLRVPAGTLARMGFHRRQSYEVECNWKVYVDNYLEGYHLPFVHPELCDLLEVGSYVTELFDRVSLQRSPLSPGDSPYAAPAAGSLPEALYYFVFPNFMLNILPGRLQTNLVVPLSPERTRVIFDYFYDASLYGPDAGPREADIAYSDKVQREDIGICELVQRGLRSRAYDRGRFSVEMERGVHHFQTLLKRAFRRHSRR